MAVLQAAVNDKRALLLPAINQGRREATVGERIKFFQLKAYNSQISVLTCAEFAARNWLYVHPSADPGRDGSQATASAAIPVQIQPVQSPVIVTLSATKLSKRLNYLWEWGRQMSRKTVITLDPRLNNWERFISPE